MTRRPVHWSLASVKPRGGWAWLIKLALLVYFTQALIGVIAGLWISFKITGVL